MLLKKREEEANKKKVFGVPYPQKHSLLVSALNAVLFFSLSPHDTYTHIYYTHTHTIGARHEERHAKVDHGHVPLENENRETRGEKSLVSTRDAVDERGHRRTTEMVERDGESEPGENGGWGGQFYGREERKNHVSRG